MIKLIKPDKNYLQSYTDAFLEYKKYNITNYNFSNPLEYDIFEKFERYEFERDIPKDHVGSLYCWLVDDEKGMFIGEINIRYRLNDNLLKRGGKCIVVAHVFKTIFYLMFHYFCYKKICQRF